MSFFLPPPPPPIHTPRPTRQGILAAFDMRVSKPTKKYSLLYSKLHRPWCKGLHICTASLAQQLRLPPRERKIRGSNHACDGIFWIESYQGRKKMALQWLPCPAPGVIGSALGLVGSVSVYCDWVRQKVGSATSISVWQHVKLSEQIRP